MHQDQTVTDINVTTSVTKCDSLTESRTTQGKRCASRPECDKTSVTTCDTVLRSHSVSLHHDTQYAIVPQYTVVPQYTLVPQYTIAPQYTTAPRCAVYWYVRKRD